MKLYISEDTQQIVTEPLFPQPITSVSFKRGDSSTVEFIFVSENTALSATSDRQLIMGIKPSGKYDGDFLVYASEYTTDGNSYVLSPNLNTEALNTLLNSGDENDTNDVASVNAMLEVTWSKDAGATWKSTSIITAVLENDVIKLSGEATPVANQTLLEWFEVYRPSPLVLSAAPIDETYSSIVINPTGDDNSLLYTSVSSGSIGNNTTVEYLSAVEQVNVTVAISGTDIKITPGSKSGFNISGATGTNASNINGDYDYDTINNTKVRFKNAVNATVGWDWTKWAVVYAGGTYFQGATSGTFPTGPWTGVNGATGTLVFTDFTSTASQVLSTVNLSASNLVNVTAVGSLSGAINTVTVTSLSGGVDGTAGTLDQNAIVNEQDVYKCVRETPVKWTQLN